MTLFRWLLSRAFLILVGLLVGCGSSERLELEARWRPLEQIVEADLPLVPDTAITTIGARCYVVDLDEFLREHPPGSVEFDAIMLHEQVHARRQEDEGLGEWLARYLADQDFAWAEEQAGWAIELRHRRARGALEPAEHYAAILARYRNARGELVSYEAALAFVRAVLAQP